MRVKCGKNDWSNRVWGRILRQDQDQNQDQDQDQDCKSACEVRSHSNIDSKDARERSVSKVNCAHHHARQPSHKVLQKGVQHIVRRESLTNGWLNKIVDVCDKIIFMMWHDIAWWFDIEKPWYMIMLFHRLFNEMFVIKAIFENWVISWTDLVMSFTPSAICGRKQKIKKGNKKGLQ
jgi:hypothetical protein